MIGIRKLYLVGTGMERSKIANFVFGSEKVVKHKFLLYVYQMTSDGD